MLVWIFFIFQINGNSTSVKKCFYTIYYWQNANSCWSTS